MAEVPQIPPEQRSTRVEHHYRISKVLDKRMNTLSNGNQSIQNVGPVKDILLPSNWTENKKNEDVWQVQDSYFKEYDIDGDDQVSLCFYYRGRPVDKDTAKAFHELLTQKPVKYRLTYSEIKALSSFLRGKDDPTKLTIQKAYTEDLAGKRVLVIESTHNKSSDRNYWIYVDTDNTGSYPHEIYYWATASKFDQNLSKAKQALETIKWR